MQDSILHRQAYGATLQKCQIPISHAAKMERDKKNQNDFNYQSESSSDESDDFMMEYRQKRMLQLQQVSNWPVFGEIIEVDIMDYTSIVDKTDPRVMVIIHMYEPSVPSCNKLNTHLEQAARQMSYASFLRMRPKKGFDTIALPVLIIYRNGELIHNWIRVVPDYLPNSYAYDDVHELLESRGGVISPYSNDFVSSQDSNSEKISPHQVEDRIKCTAAYDSDDAELDEFYADFVSM